MTSAAKHIGSSESRSTATPSKALTASERARLTDLLGELKRRETLRAESLFDFMPRVSPGMVRPDHLAPVVALFERILAGERVRACVSIPSQHGKSQLVLHALACMLVRRPTWPLIYLTYQQEQSDDQSHKARAIARAAGVDLAADRANLRMWRTSAGGGCLFTSVDGPGAGQPAQVAVVDDPYKNMAAALSPAVRKSVKATFSSVVLQRGQEGMSVIVVHTRWLEDDLIGDIARGEYGPGWEVVNLPMLARDDGSPAPRPYDAATQVLNPKRTLPDGRVFGWTLAGAQALLRSLPEHDADSMGQGKPRRRVDGALWQLEDIARLDAPPPLSRVVVFVDPNQATEGGASKADDAGVVTLARGQDGNAYVLGDASRRMGVQSWAAVAVAEYDAHNAAEIVLEGDGGGELNAQAIRAHLLAEASEKSKREGRYVAPRTVPVRVVKVGARGDKRGRCETARNLYGDTKAGRVSRVYHVGRHARLERSMTTHDFATAKRSPGDLDALSLGVHELLLSSAPPSPRYSDTASAVRGALRSTW